MRLHPIMQTWKVHMGVDYSAPSGTPVRSVGEGTVELAGWQNGYGNVVQVQHSAGRSTIYAHPVAPTAPSCAPCSMCWPLRTSMRLKWA